MKKALITGITGQDGSYLAELLLGKGYEVHGLVRRSSNPNTSRLGSAADEIDGSRQLRLHHGDLSDGTAISNLVREVQPDEVYNLAAQSHVGVSFEAPDYTSDVTGTGTVRLLEAIRANGAGARFYQASSSEMFGSTPPPQAEHTSFHPRSPYGVAKVFSYWTTVNYREAYGMHASNGILFNHESPRRGTAFVTRKITLAAARIKAGLQSELHLGNPHAVRDWGYAPEYVEAMWRMLQQDSPEDYVVGTGTAATVRDFASAAFTHAGLDLDRHLRFDRRYERPAEVDALVADATKAEVQLGWRAATRWDDLARLMVDADIKQLCDQMSGRLARSEVLL